MQTVSFWDDARAPLSTPEQVELRLEVANIGSRGLALMIDLALRYGVFLVLYLVFAISTNLHLLESELNIGLKGFALLFIFVVFVSEWFYFTLFEWIWNGQTPGKRLMRLRVIKADGSPVSWLEVVLRNFTRPVDTTGPMALIGMAFIFFQPRGQRPGDLAARTIVIRETPINWKTFFPENTAQNAPEAGHAGIPLTPQEIEMIHRYLERAPSLAKERRDELAVKLRTGLEARARGTELEHSALPAHEWLEALAQRL